MTAMRFDFPTSWRHGRGFAAHVGDVLVELGCQKALVLTDALLMELGVVDPVTASLHASGIEHTVSGDVTQEPTIALFEQMVADSGARGLVERLDRCDSIVAVGGGSVIDAAKGLAVVAQFGGHLRDYAGFDKIPEPLSRKIVAVPTTAGTGSEISDGSVWIDEAANTKFLILSTRICPTVALTDPLLTRSMPPRTTATCGVDALTHAIESFLSRDASTATEPLSLRAIELIAGRPTGDGSRGAGLQTAFDRGDDLDARESVQLGATMAMIAGMNAHMGLCHALAMPLCGLYPIPHGLACAMTLPHVLRFNAEGAEAKVAAISRALGAEAVDDSSGEMGSTVCRRLEGLLASVGMTGRLRDFGYRDDDMATIVRETRNSAQFRFNPRIPSDEDLERLVRRLI